MRKTVLYIALSIDGYIADIMGGVEWLQGHDTSEDMPDTYSVFVKTVDTVVMGWNTYHQIVTELSPTQWVYEDLETYVITHRKIADKPNVHFSSENPCELVKRLKLSGDKNIWICGGADIAQQLLQEDMIDTFHLTIIPIILGNGIRLFEKIEQKIPLRLAASHSYNGITELIYDRRCE